MARSVRALLMGAATLWLPGVPAVAQSSGSATTIAAADPLAPRGRAAATVVQAARKPPMGWSSWNAFRTEINEEKLIGSARALVDTGLAARGYTQVNIDDGWWLKRREGDGRLVVRTSIFPSAAARGGRGDTSLRPIVDRLHRMGLRAGIYTDLGRNACSQAYDLASPNLPVGTTAEREVGLYGHVDQDMRLYFREWGFDYVKVDACGLADYGADRPHVATQGYRAMPPLIVRGEPARTDAAAIRRLYEEVAQALHRHGRADSVLSICAWGQADVRAWGKDVGNVWRTSEDITPDWPSMLQSFDSAAGRPLYAHPGAWNDPDMLFIGSGEFDGAHLTEARSHLSLWAIINAPLIIGFDLRHAPSTLIDLLGNRDVVAINQDAAGNQGVVAYDSANLQIIVKTLADGRKAVALFNRSDRAVKAVLQAGHLKFADDAPVSLTDLWAGDGRTTFTGEREMLLAPHETRLFRAEGKRLLADGFYVSEMPGSVNVAVDGVRQSELDPTIYRGVSAWSGSRSAGERPVYSGWGGAQADRAPYGTTLTVAGKPFATGIGILSNSRIELRNEARFAQFSAEVGVDDSTRNRGTRVRFAVYGDGKLLAETPAMGFGEATRVLTANTAGAAIVELVVRADDPAAAPVSTTWANAALTRTGR